MAVLPGDNAWYDRDRNGQKVLMVVCRNPRCDNPATWVRQFCNDCYLAARRRWQRVVCSLAVQPLSAVWHLVPSDCDLAVRRGRILGGALVRPEGEKAAPAESPGPRSAIAALLIRRQASGGRRRRLGLPPPSKRGAEGGRGRRPPARSSFPFPGGGQRLPRLFEAATLDDVRPVTADALSASRNSSPLRRTACTPLLSRTGAVGGGSGGRFRPLFFYNVIP